MHLQKERAKCVVGLGPTGAKELLTHPSYILYRFRHGYNQIMTNEC